MRKVIQILISVIVGGVLLTACSGVSREEYEAALAANDSLAKAGNTASAELNELNSYLSMLSASVDSINAEQGIIVASIDPETGAKFSREELRARIINFSDLIQRQRARIQALSDSLKNVNNSKIAELTTLVNYLNQQLKSKEAEINSLREQVSAGKKNIEYLTANIATLNESNTKLTSENETLDRELASQTERMNEGYVLIKTKKELQAMGLLKGGFLKKTSFQAGNVDISMCRKVDIRHFNDVTLNSKKPKLLSQAPANSYTFESLGDGKTRLVILDTVAFWSLSNVVIIQL